MNVMDNSKANIKAKDKPGNANENSIIWQLILT
jgi:hypothetical protein